MDRRSGAGGAGSGAGAGSDDASTSGPVEGRRMGKLRQVLDTALDMSMKELSKPKAAKEVRRCFSTGSGKRRQTVVEAEIALSYARVAMQKVCENVREEFDEVCKQRDMVAKLNRLDSMLETRELVAGKDLPKPGIVDPSNVVRQHIVAFKLEEEKALQDMLERLNKENEELDARVAEYTTRAKRCNDSMTTKVQAVQKAGTTAATWVETQHPVG